jgi:hypothetical protein
VDRFTRELVPLVLNGSLVRPAGDGRPPVREIVAYWSAPVPREEIKRVEVVEWALLSNRAHAVRR